MHRSTMSESGLLSEKSSGGLQQPPLVSRRRGAAGNMERTASSPLTRLASAGQRHLRSASWSHRPAFSKRPSKNMLGFAALVVVLAMVRLVFGGIGSHAFRPDRATTIPEDDEHAPYQHSVKASKNYFAVRPHRAVQVDEPTQSKYKYQQGQTWKEYEKMLSSFVKDYFPKRSQKWTLDNLKRRGGSPKPQTIPMAVYQTGKAAPEGENSFQDNNPDAIYYFYDDPLLEWWADKNFAGSKIKKVWDSMERIVLKTDLWRYLVTFVEGGFYSDTDTDCLKPVQDWGTVDAAIWDVGDLVSEEVARAPPQVVVGIEVDAMDVTNSPFWPRPIQIVQWTMAGVPGHPIYLDAIRRVMTSMERIDEWKSQRIDEAKQFFEPLMDPNFPLKKKTDMMWSDDAAAFRRVRDILSVDPFDVERGAPASIVEATGPGIFSDAVFNYLEARYGIHWTQLHNIQTATRIGEVAVLPITGFAPFLRPDWPRWKGAQKGAMAFVGDIRHEQAMVNHNFAGSWRTAQDDAN